VSDFFGKLKSGAGKVAFEAEKMARLTKAKSELEGIKDQIRTQYAKIGELYYSRRTTSGVTGPEFDAVCQAIADLERQLQAKNDEVQKINAESFETPGAAVPIQPPQTTPAVNPIPSPPPTPPTGRFCPNCGKPIEPGVKFCPDCGQNLA